jgi:hypothetical protein
MLMETPGVGRRATRDNALRLSYGGVIEVERDA